MDHRKFRLSDKFLEPYKTREVPWGPVGYITYKRTYTRRLNENDPNSETEEWWQTCRRVIEGMFNIQKNHVIETGLYWDNDKAQATAKDAYERLFTLKWTPPGRGLWIVGSEFMENRTGAAAFNCSFRSTKELATRGGYIFGWMMDALMLGIGVGFDTKGAGTLTIKEPGTKLHSNVTHNTYHLIEDDYICEISDTREGWVESVVVLLDSYYFGLRRPRFVYDKIRAYGEPIRGFGGVSSGSDPLRELHESLDELYTNRIGSEITSVDILDTENLIGRCVVAGNVRRSAAIAIGASDDLAFLTAKDDQDKLYHHRWGSNNSFYAKVGQDYSWHAIQTQKNGEPGYIWMNNAKTYGRFKDGIKLDDNQVEGFNPCKPLDATILTPEGYITFEEALKKDSLKVIGPDGKTYNATKPFKTGTNREVFKVTLSNGIELLGTDNHKHQLHNGEWIETKDLKPGDKLKLLQDHSIHNVINESSRDYENGLLAGWTHGDGSFTKRNDSTGYTLQLSFGIQEFDVASFYEELTNAKAFNHPQCPETCKVISSHNSQLYNKLLDNNYSLDKTDLTWLYNKSSDYKFAFIKALFTADGSVRKRINAVELYSTRKTALLTLSNIIREFGIPCSVTVHNKEKQYIAKDSKVRNNAICYKLNISAGDYIFGFLSAQKTYDLNQLDKKTRYRWVDNAIVKSIELRSIEDVYDITVDSEDHAFIDNGVVTHNCVEINLEDGELCNIAETFPFMHSSYEDWQATLKIAYLYTKTITLAKTHWPETNAKMLKNRRIGLSVSGVVQAMNKFGTREVFNWFDKGYKYLEQLDHVYSDWLCIPRSKRMTCVKPSGTVSLLNGSTPGIHFPESEYYIRRIRFSSNHQAIPLFEKNGYIVEDCKYSPNTKVIEFPVKEQYFERGKENVSMWEQLELAAALQYYWADNGVSITVTFNDSEAKDIEHALELYETRLKAVSFLRYKETGYIQAPYEPITKEQYEEMISKITPVTSFNTTETGIGERYCSNDTCTI